jgi:enoyl-CoA hydratase/carnithine racemase
VNIFEFLKFEPFHIALMNGYCNGAGSTFSVYADIRVVSEKTSFSMPDNKIGYITDGGASLYFSRLFNKDKHLGMYYALTGKSIVGSDNIKHGVATHFIKH